MQDRTEEDPLRKAGLRVAGMVLIQITAGFANIYLLAPIWMQLVHLLLADVLWISVVLLVCEEVRAACNGQNTGCGEIAVSRESACPLRRNRA